MLTGATATCVLRVTSRLALRGVQFLVLIPSCVLGIGLAIAVISGASPVRSAVEGIYEWADTSVRGAPSNTVLVSDCLQTDRGDISTPSDHLVCNTRTVRPIRMEAAIDSSVRAIQQLYLLVVSVTALTAYVVWPLRHVIRI